jgi:hypothetical protein
MVSSLSTNRPAYRLKKCNQQLSETFVEVGVQVSRNHMRILGNRESIITQHFFNNSTLIILDLNAMKVRPPKRRQIDAGDGTGRSLVRTETDLADHVLVVGDRYQPNDFKATPVVRMGSFTSGVLRELAVRFISIRQISDTLSKQF